MIVLTLNSGSSSFKFGLYDTQRGALVSLLIGEIDGGVLQARGASGARLPAVQEQLGRDKGDVSRVAGLLKLARLPKPAAVGHRVVHGGLHLDSHCVIDGDVLRKIEDARTLSPLHAPVTLSTIRHAAEIWPDALQIACLDTAFHTTMPAVARTLPIAYELREQGICRFGFHGLSCESIVRQLGSERAAKTVVAHLGSGASVTAVLDGRSIDTTMGLTPSGGVMMGTRSGDLDPGTLLYLLRKNAYDNRALEHLIEHHSGLRGVSNVSGDLRLLHSAALTNADAELAIAMFCVSAAKHIAAMATSLGGADVIVFTGGIGEHDASVRRDICRHLSWIGIQLDEERNRQGVRNIGALDSRIEVIVLPSREDEQIALHSWRCAEGRNEQLKPVQ